MKRLLTLIMLLPLMGMAQESSDKPKKEKPKHFELWASVGMGNSSELKVTKVDPNRPLGTAPFDGQYSKYLRSSYTPMYTVNIGVHVSQRVSVGVRCNLQTVVYQYEQNLPPLPPHVHPTSPSSVPVYKSNDRIFGEPMIQLGAYGKYVYPIGVLSPFVSAQCSWVHANAYIPGIDRSSPLLKYDGIGYGVGIGVQYRLIPKLKLTAQANYARIAFGDLAYGHNVGTNQKSVSFGVLFSF